VEWARSGDGLGVEGALRKAAGDLSVAQGRMPVPLVSMGDVLSARNGQVSVGWGSFAARLRGEHVDALVDSGVWAKLIDAFIRDKEQEARVVYDEVGDDYGDASRQAPSAVAVTPGVAAGRDDLSTGDGAGTPSAPVGAPSFGSGSGVETGRMPSARGVGGLPAFGADDASAGENPALSPWGGVPAGGGLAGVAPVTAAGQGGGAVGAAVPGPAHAGGVGVSVAGAGPLVSGGLGAGISSGRGIARTPASVPTSTKGIPGGGSLGKPVSPTMGAVPMAGGGVGGQPSNKRSTGRGVAGGDGGLGPGRGPTAGAMMAPLGTRGQDDADRHTWLVEDEDIWGIGTDASPPVLRGDE
jgi:hypothetical protein